MNNKNEQYYSPPFWEDLGLSIVAHAAIVAFLIFRIVFFPPSEDLKYENAIRVDIVGLPDKVRTPQPSVAPPKPEVVKAPEPVVEKKPIVEKAPVVEKISSKTDAKSEAKKLQQSQLEALKRLEALERIEKQMKDEAIQKAKAAETKFKGNQISPGTNLTGATRLQHDAYVATLDAHIKQSWVLPQWLAQLKVRARAVVYIDEQGHIIKRQITSSSNNEAFDQKVLDAIDAADPFPVPPDKFVQVLRYQGVEFAFPE